MTTILFASCGDTPKKKIDIKNETLKVNSFRFDKALFTCDTNQLQQSVDSLGDLHPDFASVFFNQLTGFRQPGKEDVFYQSIRHFLTYKDYRNLMDTVNLKFPDTKEIDASLETLFKHVHHYYPSQTYRQVYYFVSGLNYWKAITIDTIAAVGLDMFLGEDYPHYASVQIPSYETKRCEPKFIPIFMAKTIYEKMFPLVQEDKTLLELMLQNGKELLFMEYMLPDRKESDIIGFSEKQYQWCEENEAMIWSFFSKNKLLYTKQWQEMMRYVNDGPFTSGMPQESPGNTGSWTGWRILKKYWEKHPDKTLQEILADTTPAQTILEQARYKPETN